VRANFRGTTGLVEEVVALAKRSRDPALLAEADHLAGMTCFHFGQFQAARDWLEKSAEASAYGGHHHLEAYGINMSVFCRAYLGHCAWYLGYPVRSLEIADEGLALAREISHPFSIALALNYLAMLHEFRREPDAALKRAVEARNICAEYRFDYYGAWSSLVRAWAIAESGQLDEGLAAFDTALEDFRRINAGLRISHHLGLLAGLHRKAGKIVAGLRLIDEALAIADTNNESWCNVELHRERGELLLLAGGEEAEDRAEAEFKVAIETAVRQGAKLPELRASVARAKLHAAGGMRQHARDALASIYSWFSEGLETRDLMEARKLLADL
jgi:predicted ATPase